MNSRIFLVILFHEIEHEGQNPETKTIRFAETIADPYGQGVRERESGSLV